MRRYTYKCGFVKKNQRRWIRKAIYSNLKFQNSVDEVPISFSPIYWRIFRGKIELLMMRMDNTMMIRWNSAVGSVFLAENLFEIVFLLFEIVEIVRKCWKNMLTVNVGKIGGHGQGNFGFKKNHQVYKKIMLMDSKLYFSWKLLNNFL